jgi:hypothetical protein
VIRWATLVRRIAELLPTQTVHCLDYARISRDSTKMTLRLRLGSKPQRCFDDAFAWLKKLAKTLNY